MGKEIKENEIAIKLSKFISELHEMGYGNIDVSCIVIIGETETHTIHCIPMMCEGFETPTIATLDKLVSTIKVNGMPDRNEAQLVITNEKGESKIIDRQNMTTQQVGEMLIGEMKEHYDLMVSQKGETEARLDFLRNIVYTLAKNINAWENIPTDAKINMLNDIIKTTKDKAGADWFPQYAKPEMVSVIDEIDHYQKFGYKKDNHATTDMAYQ